MTELLRINYLATDEEIRATVVDSTWDEPLILWGEHGEDFAKKEYLRNCPAPNYALTLVRKVKVTEEDLRELFCVE